MDKIIYPGIDPNDLSPVFYRTLYRQTKFGVGGRKKVILQLLFYKINHENDQYKSYMALSLDFRSKSRPLDIVYADSDKCLKSFWEAQANAAILSNSSRSH